MFVNNQALMLIAGNIMGIGIQLDNQGIVNNQHVR